MKLCFITDNYPPTSGGIAISSRRIAQELLRNGVDVYVVTFDHSKTINNESYIIQEKETNGLTIFRIGPFFERQQNLRINEKIKALLRRQILN